ncbi:MAG: PAS domain-containing sensor histidine kinase [bacterium]
MHSFEEKQPIIILAVLIFVITILHYSTTVSKSYYHEIYKTLYYIPIILAAFHFGIKGGFIASLSISGIYLPHVIIQWRGNLDDFTHRLLEILLYNVAAYIVGRLAEGERNERKKYEKVARELQESYEKLKHQSEMLAEVEEQLRHSDRLSVMGELAASLAHEVRNPLGSIKGAAEILQDDYSKENPKYEFLQILSKEVNRLNQVIENFLSLARPKPSQFKEILLREAVESVIHIVSAKARKEKIAISCHLPVEPVKIKADENKFRQVLLNLILNAMAAINGEGCITIDSHIKNHAAANKVLELMVADNGSGIPEGEMENIFKPFYTTKEHGTGLGLPITKRIIEEYNWNFHIESKVGEGTKVIVRIPRTGEKV